MELIGLYLVACLILVAAGTAKAVRPGDTARALASLVPLDAGRLRHVVRVGSLGEAALGLVALAFPRTAPAAAVAASYLLFAVFVAIARRRGGAVASCGCFGTPDTPATGLHVVVDLVLAASAAVVASAGLDGSMASVLAAQPLDGVPLLMASAVGAWLTYLAVSVLASLQAARRLTAVSFATGPTAMPGSLR
jgi:hypothetical protein